MTSTLGRNSRLPTNQDSPDPEQFRILLGTAARVPAVTMALLVTVVVTTLVAASSDLTGVYAATAGAWLGLHQVTLTIDGTALGVLPLLPTAVLVWLSARSCASAADAMVLHSGYALDGRDAARITAATLAGPLAVTVTALVVIQDASSVLPVSMPDPAQSLAWVTGLYLLSSLLGVGSRMWRPLCDRYAVPEWLVDSVRPATRAVLGMFAMGGLLTVVGMLWSWQSVGELLARGENWMGVLGLLVISILYLPNVMIGAAAVLAGSTVEFGEVRLSLFEASGGDLPALPVLAAIPPGPAPSFWPVALAVPATIGALLGRYVAKRNLEAQARGEYVSSSDGALTVLAASAEAGVVTALATWAAGGRLGFFGVVGGNWWLAGVLMFAWSGLLGIITAQLLLWREGKLAAAEAEAARAAEAEESAEPDDTEDDSDEDGESGEDAAAGELEEPKALEAAPAGDAESADAEDEDGDEDTDIEDVEDDTEVVDAEVVDDDEEPESKPDAKDIEEPDVVDAEIDDEADDGDLAKGTRNTSD
ncbi:cell division protein PerM [Rhodococcus sp. NPDC003382]